MTDILLVTFPVEEPELNIALISPVLPGGIVLEVSIAAVHPQDVFTSPIFRTLFPRFSNL